jgi:hypothetical protein
LGFLVNKSPILRLEVVCPKVSIDCPKVSIERPVFAEVLLELNF